MSPLPEVVTESELMMNASTWLSTMFLAVATPVDMDTPTMPAKETAIEAAPVIALMDEASSAITVMVPAEMPESPSPSM